MLKRILAIAVLVAGISCFAGSAVRLDINGLTDKIALKPGKSTKGLRIVNPGWMKDKAKYYLLASTGMNMSKEWKKYSFSFTPDKDGVIEVKFRGTYFKPKGSKEISPVWVAYDNITIDGAELKNGDFEFLNKKNMFDQWDGCNADNLVKDAKDAQSGENYTTVWHNNPISQKIKVKKDQQVTITVYAKASDGPKKNK